ncbi:Uncharacterized protein APZ42_030035 [Daphnia magna]|uniref:Uncharacterized protein n=1 Tax=Daphnia magna TaxID=35525 RepID=A0A164P425_9CRUS|nr:Uncharacterized protein APZ42_030035 [Daphnia magna]
MVAMFVVDSKSTVIKLTVQELETHLLGKEFSEKTTNVLRGLTTNTGTISVEQVEMSFLVFRAQLGKEVSNKSKLKSGNFELSVDKKFLNKSKSKPTSRKNFECFICKTSKRVSNPLICGQNSCSAQLMSFRSFRHHLLECEYFQGDNVTARTVVPQIKSMSENESIDGSVDVDFDVAEKTKVCEKQVQVAKLFLNLRTTFNVTNSALNFFSAEMTKILAEAAKSPLSLIENAFTNLNSQTNWSDFYIKNFGYKSPKQLLSMLLRTISEFLRFLDVDFGRLIIADYVHQYPKSSYIGTFSRINRCLFKGTGGVCKIDAKNSTSQKSTEHNSATNRIFSQGKP